MSIFEWWDGATCQVVRTLFEIIGWPVTLFAAGALIVAVRHYKKLLNFLKSLKSPLRFEYMVRGDGEYKLLTKSKRVNEIFCDLLKEQKKLKELPIEIKYRDAVNGKDIMSARPTWWSWRAWRGVIKRRKNIMLVDSVVWAMQSDIKNNAEKRIKRYLSLLTSDEFLRFAFSTERLFDDYHKVVPQFFDALKHRHTEPDNTVLTLEVWTPKPNMIKTRLHLSKEEYEKIFGEEYREDVDDSAKKTKRDVLDVLMDDMELKGFDDLAKKCMILRNKTFQELEAACPKSEFGLRIVFNFILRIANQDKYWDENGIILDDELKNDVLKIFYPTNWEMGLA